MTVVQSNAVIMGWFRTIVKWILFITFSIFCIKYWLERKTYLFCAEGVASIANRYVGEDPTVSFEQIHKEFLFKYPGHILDPKDIQWIFMNAGGWMGAMYLLHASLSEYVLFFGTAVDTTGHSGRYCANISDTILTGSFRQWREGSLKSHMYGPGDTVFHEWGEVTSVSWSRGTWMVEYGRGFIPSTLGFALADTVFSTQDFLTMFYIFRIYTKALLLEAGFYLSELKETLKDSL
ncbi:sigma non-opioid intracellular receptor 1-like [Gigantopelta aegis]|uniref:sigma non-opioid intracellular receptor 1-like n=1 Tax=Gigantopelta aegis TaxID=1735272 RepID=UPI001B88743C|nr:sigma non-opioid intracellular receptor 1-like [Gigantopelta aegis]